jgi:hypothetical protein
MNSSLIINVKYFYDAKRDVRALERGKLFKCYFTFTTHETHEIITVTYRQPIKL